MLSRSLSVEFDRGRAMDDKLKHLEFIVIYIAIIIANFAAIFCVVVVAYYTCTAAVQTELSVNWKPS